MSNELRTGASKLPRERPFKAGRVSRTQLNETFCFCRFLVLSKRRAIWLFQPYTLPEIGEDIVACAVRLTPMREAAE